MNIHYIAGRCEAVAMHFLSGQLYALSRWSTSVVPELQARKQTQCVYGPCPRWDSQDLIKLRLQSPAKPTFLIPSRDTKSNENCNQTGTQTARSQLGRHSRCFIKPGKPMPTWRDGRCPAPADRSLPQRPGVSVSLVPQEKWKAWVLIYESPDF